MSETWINYILLFFAASILGWFMEVVSKWIQYKRFINRGFLIGPYCPIYGVGAVLIVRLLMRYADDPLTVFVLAMAVCGVLEYATSYVMEKLFHARWWDYSSRRFNIDGRVCAGTLIPFGLLGLVLVYVIQPWLFELIARLPVGWAKGICIALSAVFVTDVVISVNILGKLRSTATASREDNTEALTRRVREELLRKGALHRRMIKAYPTVRIYNAQLLKQWKKRKHRFQQETRAYRQQLRDEMEQLEQKVKNELRQRKEQTHPSQKKK